MGRVSGRGVSARALFAKGDVSPPPIPRRQPRPVASCSLPTSPRPAASSAARCLRPSARSPPAKSDVPSVGSRAATRPVARGWSPPPPLSSPASAALRVGTSRAAVPWRRPRRRLSRPSTWSCCSAKSRLPPSRPRVLVRGGLVHGRPPRPLQPRPRDLARGGNELAATRPRALSPHGLPADARPAGDPSPTPRPRSRRRLPVRRASTVEAHTASNHLRATVTPVPRGPGPAGGRRGDGPPPPASCEGRRAGKGRLPVRRRHRHGGRHAPR